MPTDLPPVEPSGDEGRLTLHNTLADLSGLAPTIAIGAGIAVVLGLLLWFVRRRRAGDRYDEEEEDDRRRDRHERFDLGLDMRIAPEPAHVPPPDIPPLAPDRVPFAPEGRPAEPVVEPIVDEVPAAPVVQPPAPPVAEAPERTPVAQSDLPPPTPERMPFAPEAPSAASVVVSPVAEPIVEEAPAASVVAAPAPTVADPPEPAPLVQPGPPPAPERMPFAPEAPPAAPASAPIADETPAVAAPAAPIASGIVEEPAPTPTPETGRAMLQIALHPRRAGTNLTSAAVEYDVVVRNSGGAKAADVRLDVRLLTADAQQDALINALFAEPVERPITQPFDLLPGTEVKLGGMGILPRERISAMTADGRELFVPVITVNLLYAWAGGSGQTARSFVIGIERGAGGKMGAFRLDDVRMYAEVGALEYTIAIDR